MCIRWPFSLINTRIFFFYSAGNVIQQIKKVWPKDEFIKDYAINWKCIYMNVAKLIKNIDRFTPNNVSLILC